MTPSRFRVTIQHSPASDTRRAPRDNYPAGNHSYLIEADSIAEAVAQIPTDTVGEITPTTRIVAVEELADWAVAKYSEDQIADILRALDYEPGGDVPELFYRSSVNNLPFLNDETIIEVAFNVVTHLSGFYGATLTPDPGGDAVILEVYDIATDTYRGNTVKTKNLSDDPYAEGYDGLIALARGVINHLAALM